ncbi:SafA/ExsA family spore coat assembly protein [Bacillus fonticola]|uniref:SafA/ExsA family spore coat assembly protein n=1 Tax=Bacillus fonticola TaxID=2728853 RepID=UPI0018857938|nr:SafA/ExsA family spore coat assembly protein [Bacillus fonticola]
MKIHIVQKGDTLWKIAKKYGVNFEEVKKMNAQLSNPDMIMPGMKIKVPDNGGSVKKESAKVNFGAKKEMPMPMKEMPMPMKEMPMQKKPKEMPMKSPKMPMQISPEIDINNYYMMNMANVSTTKKEMPKMPPKPKPEVIEESSESIEGVMQPMMPLCPPGMVPVPMPPGVGGIQTGYPPHHGMHHHGVQGSYHEIPYGQMTQPGFAGGVYDESSSSSFPLTNHYPHMGQVQGAYDQMQPGYGPGYGSGPGYSPEYGPAPGYGPEYGPALGYGPAPGYGPEYGPAPGGYGPEFGPTPGGYGPEYGPAPGGYGPEFGPAPGYGPEFGPAPGGYGPEFGPAPGYGPEFGPTPGYGPGFGSPGPAYGGPGYPSGEVQGVYGEDSPNGAYPYSSMGPGTAMPAQPYPAQPYPAPGQDCGCGGPYGVPYGPGPNGLGTQGGYPSSPHYPNGDVYGNNYYGKKG